MGEARTGAALLAATIKESGTPVFGMAGGHNLTLFAALQHAGVHVCQGRHEQGAGFMAEGYARVTGRPAVVLTTAGPGITNAVTPIAHAYAESVPMVVIAVDNYSSTLATPLGRFHGLPDVTGLLSPISEWTRTADSAQSLHRLATQALAATQPRPYVIHVPSDVLAAVSAETETEPAPAPEPAARDLDREVTGLLDRLARSRRTVIFAGAGSVRARAADDVLRLAEWLDAPVVTTVQARGVIPDDHRLAMGPVWDRYASLDEYAAEADLVLCLGTSLSPLATRDAALPLRDVVQVTTSHDSRSETYPERTVIRHDVGRFVARLLDRAAGGSRDELRSDPEFAVRFKEACLRRRERLAAQAPVVHDLLEGIRAASPRDTVFVCDMTIAGYWAQRFLPVHTPGGLLSPYYFGTLGYGIPAAIGAALGHPHGPVVALCGDGGALMNFQEFAAARRHGIAVHAIVFNDNAFGAMRADLRRQGTEDVDVVDLWNPDFEELAHAYGLEYACTGPDGSSVQAALAKQVEGAAPSLLEVKVGAEIPIFYEVNLG